MGSLLTKSSSDKQPKATKNKRSSVKTPATTHAPHNVSATKPTDTTEVTILSLDESAYTLAANESVSTEANPIIDAPSTPQTHHFFDPRSPFVCRTPLDALRSAATTPSYAVTKHLDLTTDESMLAPNTPVSSAPIAQKTFLQQKLLKNLGYQEFDPRSPTQFINRTPMRLGATSSFETTVPATTVVEHEEADNTMNESMRSTEDVNNEVNESIQATELPETDIPSETEVLSEIEPDIVVAANVTVSELDDLVVSEPVISPEKSLAIDEVDSDPRSPSVNVDRTPIVLLKSTDLDEPANADVDNRAVSAAQLTPKPASIAIFQDENAAAISTTPVKTTHTSTAKKAIANNTPRTPLGCLGNKGRQSLMASGKQPSHPILFISKHQQLQTGQRKLLTTTGTPNVNGLDSKIPVLKTTGGNTWKL